MSTLLFGMGQAAPPPDQAQVRSTITVVDHDAPPAVQDAAPGFNDVGTDPDTEGGLTPRQLASYVVPSQQYVPDFGNADDDLFSGINDQVSSSGTAAAREAAGIWGHGTLKVVEGIEPVIRDGGAYGSDYFASTPRPLSGSGDQLTPAQAADPDIQAQSQATAAANSRDAYGAFTAYTTGK